MAGVTCGSCGYENEPGEFSCLECGAELRVEHAPRPKVGDTAISGPAKGPEQTQACSYQKCGGAIGPNDEVCPSCGAPRHIALGLGPGGKEGAVEAWLLTMDGQQVRVSRGERILVGRALNAKLSGSLQPFMSVSRKHLWISVSEDGNEVLLEDAGSSNGSSVNSTKLNDGAKLSVCSQTEIILGDEVSIRLEPG